MLDAHFRVHAIVLAAPWTSSFIKGQLALIDLRHGVRQPRAGRPGRSGCPRLAASDKTGRLFHREQCITRPDRVALSYELIGSDTNGADF